MYVYMYTYTGLVRRHDRHVPVGFARRVVEHGLAERGLLENMHIEHLNHMETISNIEIHELHRT